MAATRTETHWAAWWFRVLCALVARPALWATALRQFRRMLAPGWWRRPPFLPWPDRGYVRFRIETAYGLHGEATATDVITYLEWCRYRR